VIARPAHNSDPCSVSALEVFRLRAWARAYLFAVGELGLIEAVDALAAYAIVTGIDQDTAQRIMADAFGKVRE
jgi:hypothetical protein